MSIWNVVERPFAPTHRHRKCPNHTCMVVAREDGIVQSIDIPGVIRSWTPSEQFDRCWESIPISGGLLGLLGKP